LPTKFAWQQRLNGLQVAVKRGDPCECVAIGAWIKRDQRVVHVVLEFASSGEQLTQCRPEALRRDLPTCLRKRAPAQISLVRQLVTRRTPPIDG
jgi:hypothetical protein